MRNMSAITVELIDESVIDVSPKDWNEYLAFSKFDVTVQSDESYNFLQSHFREM